MIVTDNGIMLIIALIIIYFLPLKKIFEDYTVIKFILIVYIFLYTINPNISNIFIGIKNLNTLNTIINIFIIITISFFTNKKNRTTVFLTLCFFAITQANIKEQSILGLILSPQKADIYSFLLYYIIFASIYYGSAINNFLERH